MILAIIYYGIASIVLLGLAICGIRNWKYVAALYFLATFDVTSFVKIGMTISFFELGLIALLARSAFLKIRLLKLDHKEQLVIYFIILAGVSVLIAQIRVGLDWLRPDHTALELIARSFMSNGKLVFYVVCLSVLSRIYQVSQKDFIKGVALGSAPAAVAVILQYAGLGLILIHNNPSFAEVFRVETYAGQRPVGLTNEASFFSYQLAFSVAMLLVSILRQYFSSKAVPYFMMILYLSSLVLTIARTGLVLIPALCLIIAWMEAKASNGAFRMPKSLVVFGVLTIGVLLLADTSILGYDVGSRLASSFNAEADASTIERYGSMAALLQLAMHKALIFGVGIYNYSFYVRPYLSDYLRDLYGSDGIMPSFSFVIQLFSELGGVLFSILLLLAYRYYRVANAPEKYWFLTALVFAMTFQVTNFACTFFVFLLRGYAKGEFTASYGTLPTYINADWKQGGFRSSEQND